MSATVYAISPPIVPTCTVSDPATFRSHFPEFESTDAYPDSQVQFFLDMGQAACVPRAWGSMIQMGVELFAAHMLALQRYAYVRASGGGASSVPGLASGLMNSKSVSKVSVGYDLSTTAAVGGGPWNYTVYGQQFYWWLHLMGIGGFETLALGLPETMSGTVISWSRGVVGNWIGPH